MVRSANNKAWDAFVDWCRRRGLSAVPANPWSLAAFVRWCEPRHTPRAIAKMIKEISRVHESKTRRRLDRDELVLRTLHMVEARHAAKRDKPRVELFEAEDADAKTAAPAKKPARARKPREPKQTPRAKPGLSPTPRLVRRRKLPS